MRQVIAPFLCGLLFALGLGLSGMTRPEKVLGFLRLEDPDLMFVMGGAVVVTLLGFPVIRRRGRAAFASLHLPTTERIDRPLLLGAALFGVGWGLAGLCPGPALTDLVSLDPGLLLFCAAMLVGLALVPRRQDRQDTCG